MNETSRKANLQSELGEIEAEIERVTTAIGKARGNATDDIVSSELQELHERRTRLLEDIDAIDRRGDAI